MPASDAPRRHDFPVTNSELLVDAPIIAVRRDTVTMPGGHAAHREIVEHFGAVAVVAVDDAGRVGLVEQYRQCVRRRLWELPAGILDIAGEDPLVAASRELVEETGTTAERWHLLVDLVTSPGFCEEACRVYLARGLAKGERPAGSDDEEADMGLEWVPLETALARIRRGEIHNSIAVAGLYAAHDALRGDGPLRDPEEPFALRPRSLPKRRQAAGAHPGQNMKRVGLGG